VNWEHYVNLQYIMKTHHMEVEYTDLPVVVPTKTIMEFTDTREYLRQFLKAKPFKEVLHPYSLEFVHKKGVAGDKFIDTNWLHACNKHLLSLSHEDALLLTSYRSIGFNEFLRHEHTLFCFINFDFDTFEKKKQFLQCIFIYKEFKKEEDVKAFFQKQVQKKLPEELVKELFENVSNNDIHMKRLQQKGVDEWFQGLSYKSPIFRFLPRRQTQQHWILVFFFYTRFAFQYVEILAKVPNKEYLFNTQYFSPTMRKTFSQDMRSFERSRGVLARFEYIYRYVYYIKQHVFESVLEHATAKMESIFASFPPLRKSMAVYRGVPEKKWAKKLRSWSGLISTTLRASIASWYTAPVGDCCLLTLHIPHGNKVIPILGLTDGNYHMELLLPHNTKVKLRNNKAKRIVVHGEEWPRESMQEKGRILKHYVFDVLPDKHPEKIISKALNTQSAKVLKRNFSTIK
jgi:ADP-ribosyltransferase exoenzyme